MLSRSSLTFLRFYPCRININSCRNYLPPYSYQPIPSGCCPCFLSSDSSTSDVPNTESASTKPTRPGITPIVQKNLDRFDRISKRRKRLKPDQNLEDETDKSSLVQTAQSQMQYARNETIEQDKLHARGNEEKVRESSSSDPSDEFGTLSIGQTEIPADGNDPQTKAVRAQLRELDRELYSIDAPNEEDDVKFIPENSADRMNMRKLRIKTKEFLHMKMLPEALDLFTKSIKAGGFNYDMNEIAFLYHLLIAHSGHAGHVKMAFQLFSDMKRRGCKVKPHTYTSLFNSIANSIGDKEENLARLESTRQKMIDKGFMPNLIHYHAMIKAYGRLGQIKSAFALVDEMIQKSAETNERLSPNSETFNFLLQACISDKENGFRHSLVTWKKMLDMRIRPDHFTVKLFLRATRECGIVIPKSVRKLLRESSAQNAAYISSISAGVDDSEKSAKISDPDFADMKLLPPLITSGLEYNCESILTDLVENDNNNNNNNSMDSFPANSELITFLVNSQTPERNVQTLLKLPENRLAILGGFKSIIAEIERHRIRADIKSVTELVQIVHPLDIPDLMHITKTHNVKLDVDFYNLMIQKYVKWGELGQARKVLGLMHRSRLHPNVMTWGIFTLACKTWKNAKRLLLDMDAYNIEPNLQIMGGLLSAAFASYSPHFFLRVMEETKQRRVEPDAKYVEKVVDFRAKVKRAIVDFEKGAGLEAHDYNLQRQLLTNYDEFSNYWTKFKMRYETWIENIPQHVLAQVKNPELIDDPWKEDYVNRVKSLKTMRQDL